jgi:C1A family cysteine protease
MTVSAQDPPTREAQMAGWVSASGPLSICVDAHNWQTYDSGVMSADACGTNINHCVQAVGLDTDQGFWKVRNSWGFPWGEDGHIRLSYGSNTCGLVATPSYTNVAQPAGASPSAVRSAPWRMPAASTNA